MGGNMAKRQTADMPYRNRIRELKHVRAADLVANPLNWRTHGAQQKAAMTAVLQEVGMVDAILVTENGDGTYQIIDGHMRAGLMPEATVPCLVLDLTAEESTKVLLTFDPIAAMADSSSANLDALLRSVEFSSESLQQLVADLADKASLYDVDQMAEADVDKDAADDPQENVNMFSCPVTVEQELSIRKAIAKAKKESGATVTGDALMHIVEAYLG
jgi:hypothetical protein